MFVIFKFFFICKFLKKSLSIHIQRTIPKERSLIQIIIIYILVHNRIIHNHHIIIKTILLTVFRTWTRQTSCVIDNIHILNNLSLFSIQANFNKNIQIRHITMTRSNLPTKFYFTQCQTLEILKFFQSFLCWKSRKKHSNKFWCRHHIFTQFHHDYSNLHIFRKQLIFIFGFNSQKRQLLAQFDLFLKIRHLNIWNIFANWESSVLIIPDKTFIIPNTFFVFPTRTP